MSDQEKQDIQELSPDGLLTHFTKGNWAMFIGAALVMHLIILAGTGYPTISSWLAGEQPEADEQQNDDQASEQSTNQAPADLPAAETSTTTNPRQPDNANETEGNITDNPDEDTEEELDNGLPPLDPIEGLDR